MLWIVLAIEPVVMGWILMLFEIHLLDVRLSWRNIDLLIDSDSIFTDDNLLQS